MSINSRSLVCVLIFSSAITRAAASLPTQPASDSCALETRRAVGPLRLDDGRAVYVEPMAFARTSRSSILAGEPMYVGAGNHAAARSDTAHRLVGVTLEGEHLRPLPRPDVPGVVTHLRLAPDDGEYVAVFAVTDSSSVGRYDEVVLSYWWGRTDGRVWRSLEQLPLPSGLLVGRRASELVRAGDEWLLAIPYRTADGQNVAVYARSQGRWLLDTIATEAAAYVALTAVRDVPILYVVYPASTGADTNSLWLFVRLGESWYSRGRVIRGGNRPVHDPMLASHGPSRVLSWIRVDAATGTRSAFAALVDDTGALGAAHLLARDVEYWDVIRGPTSAAAWVIGVAPANDNGRLAFVEWRGDRPRVIDLVTNPFMGPMLGALLATRATALGPIFDRSNTKEPLTSGVLRFVRRCASAIETP